MIIDKSSLFLSIISDKIFNNLSVALLIIINFFSSKSDLELSSSKNYLNDLKFLFLHKCEKYFYYLIENF